MRKEFENFIKILNTTKTNKVIQKEVEDQYRLKKTKTTEENKRKLENTGVFKLFEKIIENKIVEDGIIRTGIDDDSGDYFVSLIFNKESDGSYDFCSLSTDVNTRNVCGCCYSGEYLTRGDIKPSSNFFECNEKFRRENGFNVIGYISEKIKNPDHFEIAVRKEPYNN